MSKTYSPKLSEVQRDWLVIDAAGLTLGRLCTEVARRLTGKHKPTYTPHLDVGDFVVIVNAEQAVLTGRKEDQKVYHRHSGYPGGLRTETARKLRARKPTKMIENAVWGMLPKNSLGRRQLRKLKVYAGPDHPHAAQQPTVVNLAGAAS